MYPLFSLRIDLKPYSLKQRLILLLVLSVLAPIILIGSISYYSMNSILENKTQTGIKTNLHQVRLSLDELLRQLNQVSQQLAFDSGLNKELEQYMQSSSLDKKMVYDKIQAKLNLIQFTNPSAGLMFYFIEGSGEYLLPNYPVLDEFKVRELPVFDRYRDITYYGPHQSQSSMQNKEVMSIVRKVEAPYTDSLYVYIESALRLEDDLLDSGSFGLNVSHLIVDHTGVVTYSQKPSDFPVGSNYQASAGSRDGMSRNYLFEETGSQNWKVVAAISKKEYESEVQSWMIRFAGSAILTLMIGIVIARLIWRSLYGPMRQLSQNIRSVKHEKWDEPKQSFTMIEFESIMQDFYGMREKMGSLMRELEAEGKRKGQLEIEKLMYQINPHFLHNTLDTLRWTARMDGYSQMDTLISALIKVLHYNLGKSGPATIRSEIENVKSYTLIQEHRYQFQFHIRLNAEPDTLDLPIPRFVLQPIVENAIYHGLSDHGTIVVTISKMGEHQVLIRVEDNGRGMEEAEIARILNRKDEEAPGASGIGLAYVRRMVLEFGEYADMKIQSKVGEGTTVVLLLPVYSSERAVSK
ncbi:histidine kinase [Paenibacillus pasadenensis]|uniref:sensor histidine kinase n=1 Tax=Paenibacillus pasadenensis TaxID=217090 RepID=UPI00203AB4FE|nr:histidine kinase [Paenibacillus pasadenensis]MCM3747524.1 histidine kinase [Paenibacillus pasadenensis]